MARLSELGVIVTGGAQGLGEAIVRRLLSEGAKVVIADVNVEAGQALAETLGARTRFVELDVRSEPSWTEAAGEAQEFLGEINGLVNNAAVFWMGQLVEMPVETAEQLLDVNLLGPLLGTRTIAPRMASTGGGSIVNIASIDAMKAMNSIAAYVATKWGLRGLTKASALELGRDGIRVNAVCPSTGNPAISAPFIDQMDLNKLASSVPTSVLVDGDRVRDVTMGDIAAMVAFLMSDDSATCTGSDFVVDAGWTAGENLAGLPGF